MRMLCFLESLLLCDKNNINAEGQRRKIFTIVVMGVLRLGESLGERGGSFADGVRKWYNIDVL
jgi:hypothetical protein